MVNMCNNHYFSSIILNFDNSRIYFFSLFFTSDTANTQYGIVILDLWLGIRTCTYIWSLYLYFCLIYYTDFLYSIISLQYDCAYVRIVYRSLPLVLIRKGISILYPCLLSYLHLTLSPTCPFFWVILAISCCLKSSLFKTCFISSLSSTHRAPRK